MQYDTDEDTTGVKLWSQSMVSKYDVWKQQCKR